MNDVGLGVSLYVACKEREAAVWNDRRSDSIFVQEKVFRVLDTDL